MLNIIEGNRETDLLGNAERLLALSSEYADDGRWEDVVATLEALSQLVPTDAEVTYRLGIAQLKLNDMEAAIKRFRQTIRLSPAWAEAHHQLGRTLHQMKQIEASEEAYAAAIGLDAEHWRALVGFGSMVSLSGDYSLARRIFGAAINLQPNQADIRRRAGFSCENAEDIVVAIDHYREALRLDPDIVGVAGRLVTLLWRTGDHKEAEDVCRNAIDRFPGDPLTCLNMGTVLFFNHSAAAARPYWSIAAATKDKETARLAKEYLHLDERDRLRSPESRPSIQGNDNLE